MTIRAQRILIVTPDLQIGGAELVLLRLAEEFLTSGREVHLVSLTSGGALRNAVPAGVVLHDLAGTSGSDARGLALAIRTLPKLVRLLRVTKPNAVLSSMTGTNFLSVIAGICVRRKARLVLREEASAINIKGRIRRVALPKLYLRADAIIAVSKGVALDLKSLGVAISRVHVLHNPVDVPRLRELAKIGPELPGGNNQPYVIALGRLVKQKDHVTLLRAYAASGLRKTHRLVIVGEGDQRAVLEGLAYELGIGTQVSLPGAMINPYRVLAGAALHVLSSRWEGLGNVLLEAMALDVPVVSTDCPHGPREILDGGRYGRLAAVGDPVGLAQAMDAEFAYPSGSASDVLAAHDPRVIAARHLAVLDGETEGLSG